MWISSRVFGPAAIGLAFALLGSSVGAQVAGGGPTAVAMAGCGGDLARLSPLSGWQARWPAELAQVSRLDAAGRAAALARWRAAPGALDADLAALRPGGAPAAVAGRVREQIGGLLQGPIAPELTDPDWRAFLDGDLREAIVRFERHLATAYVSAAPDGSPLAGSAAGQACFAGAVAQWTSMTISPEALEAAGRRDLARYRAQLADLAGIPERELPALLERLRAGDPAARREDILAVTRAALARAEAAAPRAFGDIAIAPLSVTPIAANLEATLPAGFYAPADGAAPARYDINLSRPADRRLMAEAIAFHEGVPGHHLGFVLAKAPGTFNSGFVEGWGIYAEHLAEELGLYSTRQDRMGAAAKHLWASARLVIEPGLHVRGWSRAQAIVFLRENSALSEAEAAVEVDRYLAMPGQSVAYMLGHDVIAEARARTERRQGAAFDLAAFHRAVLEPGPRPLARLAAEFP
ncbi:MAG: DUF885 domain-containing protein [Pseudomonadota bacterium]